MYGEKELFVSFGIDNTSDYAYRLFFNALLDINDFLVKRNIGFMMVIFPYDFQLSDDPKDNFFNIDKNRFTINPQEKIVDFGRRNKILTLDLLPSFKKANRRIYFPLDHCHPNAYGHRIAAYDIYNILKKDLK